MAVDGEDSASSIKLRNQPQAQAMDPSYSLLAALRRL
jgi:hypothetical protein